MCKVNRNHRFTRNRGWVQCVRSTAQGRKSVQHFMHNSIHALSNVPASFGVWPCFHCLLKKIFVEGVCVHPARFNRTDYRLLHQLRTTIHMEERKNEEAKQHAIHLCLWPIDWIVYNTTESIVCMWMKRIENSVTRKTKQWKRLQCRQQRRRHYTRAESVKSVTVVHAICSTLLACVCECGNSVWACVHGTVHLFFVRFFLTHLLHLFVRMLRDVVEFLHFWFSFVRYVYFHLRLHPSISLAPTAECIHSVVART